MRHKIHCNHSDTPTKDGFASRHYLSHLIFRRDNIYRIRYTNILVSSYLTLSSLFGRKLGSPESKEISYLISSRKDISRKNVWLKIENSVVFLSKAAKCRKDGILIVEPVTLQKGIYRVVHWLKSSLT